MDYLGEVIALGVNSVVFVICLKKYLRNRNAEQMVEGAPLLEINPDLLEIVATLPENKLSHVAIRGSVIPIGPPIASVNNPKFSGVVQLLSIKEHILRRNTVGLWFYQKRTIQEVHNVMPFAIESNGLQVEVVDPLAADILDMDVISDQFQPNVPSVLDLIWSLFAGVRQRGVQTTEKMLKKDTIITGIGELTSSPNSPGIRLQPPTDGTPFYLTNMPITSLIKKLNDRKRNYKLLCVCLGTIGVIIVSLMLRKYLVARSRKLREEELKRELEKNRKERRRLMRDVNLSESQLCVVCRECPREIILLPCGHVCLCEDCSDHIREHCPVCRKFIERKLPAYIS